VTNRVLAVHLVARQQFDVTSVGDIINVLCDRAPTPLLGKQYFYSSPILTM
jgi:hypothetical protein